MGLPEVPPIHRRELDQANEIVRRTANLLRVAHAAGAEYILEHPRPTVAHWLPQSSRQTPRTAVGHARCCRIKIGHVGLTDNLPSMRARCSSSEIHVPSCKRWASGIAAKSREPTLSAYDAH
eukprot:5348042-Pleurochrysis_carterae.AAC.1